MDFNDLCKNYLLLLSDNKRLTKENNRLRARLGMAEIGFSGSRDTVSIEEKNVSALESAQNIPLTDVNNSSDTTAKIKRFMSLFKGRTDVHAMRWENKKSGKSGYSPVCI
jgi:hypothetical protein